MKTNLNFYISYAKSILKDLNIPFVDCSVALSKRASTRVLGNCHRKMVLGKYYFDITLNPALFQESADDDAIMNTLLHEYIHTCEGCFDHGRMFKYYANLINNKYHYNIARTNSVDSYGVVLPKTKFKYEIVCSHCGRVVARKKRKCELVENIENGYGDLYRCSCCHTKGEFKIINL